MTKDFYRQACLEKLHTVLLEKLSSAHQIIWPLLFKENLWQHADAVLAYSSLNDEIDSALLIEHSLSMQKSLFLPCIQGQNMLFRQVFDINLHEKHPWGFCQPNQDAPLFRQEDFQAPLLIAPAVAASPSGCRLGRGKGFYDRWLHQHQEKITPVVVILEDLLLNFPKDSFDMPFEYILSEKGLVRCV